MDGVHVSQGYRATNQTWTASKPHWKCCTGYSTSESSDIITA